MAKPEWGQKHTCANCGAKFYDFKKDQPACPKCETVVKPASKGKRAAAEVAAVPKPDKGVAAVAKEKDPIEELADLETDVVDDDEDDAALMVVDDDDDDDDDDFEEIKEHMMPGDED